MLLEFYFSGLKVIQLKFLNPRFLTRVGLYQLTAKGNGREDLPSSFLVLEGATDSASISLESPKWKMSPGFL